MAVPYTFGSATTSIPLSQLDSNFATTITLGNTAIQLGNTVTTLNNMTLANTTISSGNVTITTLTAPTHNSASSLTFQTNGTTTAVTIDTSQNVGIGTTSPSAKLHVSGGSSYITGASNGTAQIQFFNNAQTTSGFQVGQGYASNTDNIGYVFNTANAAIALGTNNAERMRIDSSGNVGIGTTSPSYRLDVSATSFIAASVSTSYSGAGNIRIADASTTSASAPYIGSVGNNLTFGRIGTAEYARIDSSGNLVVGVNSNIGSSPIIAAAQSSTGAACFGAFATSSSYVYNILDLNTATASGTGFNFIKCRVSNYGATVFQVIGNGNAQNANNSYGATSDIKLKENIVDATPKLASLMQVKIRNYNLKSDPTHKQIGVIAQELEEVFPAMVEETPDKDAEGNDLGTTTKAVKYSVFVPMLIKAIQELKAINDQQAETINALTARVVALESK